MPRVRIEAAMAVVFAIWAGITLIWPDWIETTIGVDPDSGSGTAEWAVIIVLAAIAVVAAALARRDYLRVSGRSTAVDKTS
jgi:hypothetical protein